MRNCSLKTVFTAEVLRDNRSMQTVLHKSDCSVKSEMHEGVYSYTLDFGR